MMMVNADVNLVVNPAARAAYNTVKHTKAVAAEKLHWNLWPEKLGEMSMFITALKKQTKHLFTLRVIHSY